MLGLDLGVSQERFAFFARAKRGCTPETKSIASLTRIQRGSTATSAMKQTSLHQLGALLARIEAEHGQIAFDGGETQDRLQRSGLAGAVRTDQSDDAARFDVETHAVESHRRTVALGDVACVDDRVGGGAHFASSS